MVAPYATPRPETAPPILLSGINWQTKGGELRAVLYALVGASTVFGGKDETAIERRERGICTGETVPQCRAR